MKRRLLFISHANPQENTFALWLATQLACTGYQVWSDVTDLLGGEKFWDDITEAIERFAFRVLFVSTLASNRKPGTLKELRIACETEDREALKDFVVPLRVDHFPFDSTDRRIRHRNFVRFEDNWAAGLSQLFDLLDREGAPLSPAAGPDCVTDWYQRSIAKERKAVLSNVTCHSNWFALNLPKRLYLHRWAGTSDQLSLLSDDLKFPSRVHGDGLIAFAPPSEVHPEVGAITGLSDSVTLNTASFVLDGSDELSIAPFDARNIVSDLLRQAWEAEMNLRGLISYQLASGLNAWFYKINHLEFNRAYLPDTGKKKRYRQLVGMKSRRVPDGSKLRDGYWHYAVSASPQLVPFPRLALRHHVIFTDDGQTPWTNSRRMFRARRRVCKNWWNAQWRDRLFAFCNLLSDEQHTVRIPVSENEAITCPGAPMTFTSPWTYFEEHDGGLDDSTEIELVEDETEDEEEEDESEEESEHEDL